MTLSPDDAALLARLKRAIPAKTDKHRRMLVRLTEPERDRLCTLAQREPTPELTDPRLPDAISLLEARIANTNHNFKTRAYRGTSVGPQTASDRELFTFVLAALRENLHLRERVDKLTQERDDWKRTRHAFEAQLFGVLHEALDYPDDKTVPEMIDMLIEWRKAETRGGDNG